MDMAVLIEALKACLFGIVEGITEWLPISSTGHMMLLEQFVQLDVSEAFYSTFIVVIQLGAIMAVILLYFHKLNPFSRRKTPEQKRTTWNIWGKVVVGSIPAAIVGLLLDDWMEEHVMTNEDVAAIVVASALIVYGIIFIVLELRNRKKLAFVGAGDSVGASGPAGVGGAAFIGRDEPVRGKHARRPEQGTQAAASGPAPAYRSVDPDADAEYDASSAIAKVNTFDELSYGRAFAIGIFQSLAVVPGTSRSGSIIIGSMILGTSRTIATEFAFFLAIPIMLGWSLLKFIKHGFAYTPIEWMIFAIGLVVAFAVSVVSIKFLVGFVKKHDFIPFGVYRIIVGVVVLAYFLLLV